MPLYVYSCPECDVVVEEIRSVGMADWPAVECPVCHGLCEREVTSARLAGGASPLDNAQLQRLERRQAQIDPVSVLHGPGCPCCRTV